jgi:DNA modification methylase
MPIRIETDRLKPHLNREARRRRESQKRSAEVEETLPPLRNDLFPDLKLVSFPIDDLELGGRKARKFGPEHVAEVEASIREFGYVHPILVGKGRHVIDGHVVVEALRKLGRRTVQGVHIEHLSREQERALRIALNQIGSSREYDLPELRLELTELKAAGQPIANLGFTSNQLDQILASLAPREKLEGAPDHERPPVSRMGDLWRLGDHLLLCGDAKDQGSYKRLLKGETAQLALTDPPYAVAVANVVSSHKRDFVEGGGDMNQAQFEALIQACFTALRDHLTDGGMLLSFMDWKHVADLIVIGKALGLELINLITWVKSQGGMGSLWRSQSEFVVALKKPGKHKNNINLGKTGRDRTNVWHVAGAGTNGTEAREWLKHHPTPKPVEMLVDVLIDVTDRGDLVLDPFAGSGSTLIACERAERRARLIELDPIYCDLIIRRWEEETGEQAVLDETGDRFMVVAEERAGSAEAGDE